jgi:hypothetical protein
MSAGYADELQKIRTRRKQGWRAIVLTAFGDESHDEAGERVYAVGGVVGSQEEFDALEVEWNKRTGGIPFHAADCESDRGDYAAASHSENMRLYADLTKLLCSTRLIGFGTAISLRDCYELFPAMPENQPYYIGFHHAVRYFSKIGFLHVPRQKVHFTFDRQLEMKYNATFLYDHMVRQPEIKYNRYLDGEVSFADRSKVGIQAADLVVRESMKDLDNTVGPVKRPTRRSMMALLKAGDMSLYRTTAPHS